MVASLGCDVDNVCAAARAGIVRSQVIENYRIRSAVEGDEQPVNGHPTILLTRGFEGQTRLVRLIQGALTDLLARTPHIDWRERLHRFYLSLPDSRRVRSGAELIADEAAREEITRPVDDEDEQPKDDPAARSRAAERILGMSADLVAWPSRPMLGFTSFAGHTGGLEIMRAALADLQAGVCEVAVVVGADSLLDEGTLRWLHVCGRLKCDGAPTGLLPGEAGVAIALSRSPIPNESVPAASVRNIEFAAEPRTLLLGASPVGEGLADVLGRAWSRNTGEFPWIVSDQNGEVYRAMDWGCAAVRLRAQDAAFASPVLWYPAVSLGDTGAASALVGICMAVRAWQRNYAPAEGALISATSDGEARAALALART